MKTVRENTFKQRTTKTRKTKNSPNKLLSIPLLSVKKVIKHRAPFHYTILPYTYSQARKLHVSIEESDKPKYKLKVITKDGKIVYCGASGFNDYPTYLQEYGKTFADKRRRLYKIRHEKDRHIAGTRGYYADRLLW